MFQDAVEHLGDHTVELELGELLLGHTVELNARVVDACDDGIRLTCQRVRPVQHLLIEARVDMLIEVELVEQAIG